MSNLVCDILRKLRLKEENTPSQRKWGTSSLARTYAEDTPEQKFPPETYPMHPLFEKKKMKFVRKKEIEEVYDSPQSSNAAGTVGLISNKEGGPENSYFAYSGVPGTFGGFGISGGSAPFMEESEPHSVVDEKFDSTNPVHQWIHARLTKPKGPHTRITPHEAYENFKEFNVRHAKNPEFGGQDVGIHEFIRHMKDYAGISPQKNKEGVLFFNAGLHMPPPLPKSIKQLRESWDSISGGDMSPVGKGTDERRFDEDDDKIVDLSKKRDEKKTNEFASDLNNRVKERVKEQAQLVRKYKEEGKFAFDVGDRFSTSFTRERNQPPYKVVGHYVDVPRKGGSTKHGYYVERRYGEGPNDVEKHRITIFDGKTDFSDQFQKHGTIKSIKEDWQKVNRQDKTDGLSQKAVNAYRRENPGSKLKTAVTEKNPKGKRAKRRLSFCRRMGGMKKRLTSAKTARDPDSRINKALRRWNCEE